MLFGQQAFNTSFRVPPRHMTSLGVNECLMGEFQIEKNIATFIAQRSSLVPHGHMMIGRSRKWVEPCNQLSITEIYMNMTDISNETHQCLLDSQCLDLQ